MNHEQISRMFMNNSRMSDQAWWLWLKLSGPPWCIDFMSRTWKRWIWCSCSRNVAPWAVMLKYLWSGRYREIPAITGQRAQVIVKLWFLGQDAFLVNCGSLVKSSVAWPWLFETTNSRRHAKSRMTDSQTSLETVFPWDVVVHDAVHEPNHQICGNDVCSWAWWPSISPMRTAHEHDVEKYVHDVIMKLEKSWWLPTLIKK